MARTFESGVVKDVSLLRHQPTMPRQESHSMVRVRTRLSIWAILARLPTRLSRTVRPSALRIHLMDWPLTGMSILRRNCRNARPRSLIQTSQHTLMSRQIHRQVTNTMYQTRMGIQCIRSERAEAHVRGARVRGDDEMN